MLASICRMNRRVKFEQANIGADVNVSLSFRNAVSSSFSHCHFTFFLVSRVSGAEMVAKFLIKRWYHEATPRNWRTFFSVVEAGLTGDGLHFFRVRVYSVSVDYVPQIFQLISAELTFVRIWSQLLIVAEILPRARWDVPRMFCWWQWCRRGTLLAVPILIRGQCLRGVETSRVLSVGRKVLFWSASTL